MTNAAIDMRPWGSFTVLDSSPAYKVKRIEVLPNKRLSYQRHTHRSEHWFVVVGKGSVTLNGSERFVWPGSAVDIPVATWHRIANIGSEVLVFFEVQHGESFEESDIERREDDFGRA